MRGQRTRKRSWSRGWLIDTVTVVCSTQLLRATDELSGSSHEGRGQLGPEHCALLCKPAVIPDKLRRWLHLPHLWRWTRECLTGVRAAEMRPSDKETSLSSPAVLRFRGRAESSDRDCGTEIRLTCKNVRTWTHLQNKVPGTKADEVASTPYTHGIISINA